MNTGPSQRQGSPSLLRPGTTKRTNSRASWTREARKVHPLDSRTCSLSQSTVSKWQEGYSSHRPLSQYREVLVCQASS
ncbi:hypothetical protein FGO68_gene12061 [Halteria grandinella]|uniref:Uncharacterized protein n=1 Tax=Halteria grandinella TaxID=5974 RepID=A0A8J8SW41_HALGN|nr:hypothetical protein FGO68_gene12061 [Halteria grandinella]